MPLIRKRGAAEDSGATDEQEADAQLTTESDAGSSTSEEAPGVG